MPRSRCRRGQGRSCVGHPNDPRCARQGRRSARRPTALPITRVHQRQFESERPRKIERPDHQRGHHHCRDERALMARLALNTGLRNIVNRISGECAFRSTSPKAGADNGNHQQSQVERTEAAARSSWRAHKPPASAPGATCRRGQSGPFRFCFRRSAGRWRCTRRKFRRPSGNIIDEEDRPPTERR